MPLPDTPNGRIARHLSQRLDVVGEQKSPTATPRGGKRGLGPGVAAADHDHIEGGGRLHHFAEELTETNRILKPFHDERQCFTWNFKGSAEDPVNREITGELTLSATGRFT